MRKTMKNAITGFLLLAAVFAVPGEAECAKASPPPVKASQPDGALELYTMANGKIGLLQRKLTVGELKKILTANYKARITEAQEPGGEGSTVSVINAYIPAATTDQPAVKIILDPNGEIYQLIVLSPAFKTPEGIRVGSTWAQVKTIYPAAKITYGADSPIVIGIPGVNGKVASKSGVDWNQVIRGKEEPPDDAKIASLWAIEEELPAQAVVDKNKVKPGDVIAGLTVSSLDIRNGSLLDITFAGDIELSGISEWLDYTGDGAGWVFTVNENSMPKIPALRVSSNVKTMRLILPTGSLASLPKEKSKVQIVVNNLSMGERQIAMSATLVSVLSVRPE